MERTSDGEVSARHLLYSLVGWGLHAAFGLLAFFSGLVAPPGGVAVIISVWFITAVVSVARWRRSAWIPLAMGILAGTSIIAILAFGDAVLGWSA